MNLSGYYKKILHRLQSAFSSAGVLSAANGGTGVSNSYSLTVPETGTAVIAAPCPAGGLIYFHGQPAIGDAISIQNEDGDSQTYEFTDAAVTTDTNIAVLIAGTAAGTLQNFLDAVNDVAAAAHATITLIDTVTPALGNNSASANPSDILAVFEADTSIATIGLIRFYRANTPGGTKAVAPLAAGKETPVVSDTVNTATPLAFTLYSDGAGTDGNAAGFSAPIVGGSNSIKSSAVTIVADATLAGLTGLVIPITFDFTPTAVIANCNAAGTVSPLNPSIVEYDNGAVVFVDMATVLSGDTVTVVAWGY